MLCFEAGGVGGRELGGAIEMDLRINIKLTQRYTKVCSRGEWTGVHLCFIVGKKR